MNFALCCSIMGCDSLMGKVWQRHWLHWRLWVMWGESGSKWLRRDRQTEAKWSCGVNHESNTATLEAETVPNILTAISSLFRNVPVLLISRTLLALFFYVDFCKGNAYWAYCGHARHQSNVLVIFHYFDTHHRFFHNPTHVMWYLIIDIVQWSDSVDN